MTDQAMEEDLEKPNDLSATDLLKKNDPLGPYLKYFSEKNGFLKRTCEFRFQNDFSAFMPLVRESYRAHSTFDNDFGAYVSFGMYQYYCVILLWRRLLHVTSPGSEWHSAFKQLTRYLDFELPVPTDVSMYINSVGHVTDFTGRKFELYLQTYFTADEIMGAQGTYGRIDENSAVLYETLPSPFVALEKMRQDLIFTMTRNSRLSLDVKDWDLPQNIRPLEGDATLPNANLLGWSPSDVLTREQLSEYISKSDFGVKNIGRLPINQTLMKYVAGKIGYSTCKATTPTSTTATGSVAQIPYAIRSNTDNEIENLRGVGSKSLITACYSQTSSYVASIAATFRFRLQRRNVNESDTLCYRFAKPPDAWLANENSVFNAGNVDLWNVDDYCIPEQDGSSLQTQLASRVRRQVFED